jgi:inner membrane protein COX18
MLASRLLRQQGRQCPPRQPIRAFHATAPRKDGLSILLYLPHELLHFVHTSCHLPWYVALPTTAFLVRALVVTTAGSFVRSSMARYTALVPLRQATQFQVQKQIMKRRDFKHPKEARKAFAAAFKARIKALDRRWDTNPYHQIGWSIGQLPIFLVMAETVRRMCAARDGMLAMAMKGLGMGTDITETKYAADIDSNPWFESSLANEGMLWFPDLLLPDPTGTLPFILSGLVFTNIWISKSAPGNSAVTEGRLSKYMKRGMLGFALMLGFLCQHVPASMLLYWVSSTSSVMVWNKWLDWRYPIVKGMGKCARPLFLTPLPPRAVPKLPSGPKIRRP